MHNEHGSAGKVMAAFVAGAATALVAGGYLLYGPNGKRHRSDLERWIKDAKEDVLERMSELKDVSQKAYETIVDEVLEDYALARDLTESQMHRLGARFKAK